MKVTYIGANCRKGVSEKNGNAYTISELLYAIDDESGQKKNDDGSIRWTYIGHGAKTRSLPVDPSRLSQFEKVEPFTEVNLLLEPQPDNPSRNWVVGIN